MKQTLKSLIKPKEIRIDLGCGPNKKEGFIGADRIKFDNVDVILEIGGEKWPWKDNSVTEAHASHLVEHFGQRQRTHFVNELYRVLIPGGKATIIVPHWASMRAYGDPTHAWPPVSEFWFYYLKQEWRDKNAPHTDIKHTPEGYTCDFDIVAGYAMRQDLTTRNQEYQQFAISNYKEVCQDIIATFTKPDAKSPK